MADSSSPSTLPSVSKKDNRIIDGIIQDMKNNSQSDNKHDFNDHFLKLLFKHQVVPEKQIQISLGIAFSLTDLSHNVKESDKDLSETYLNLSTQTIDFIRDTFGGKSLGSDRRTAKVNAIINVENYFCNVEPMMGEDPSDDESSFAFSSSCSSDDMYSRKRRKVTSSAAHIITDEDSPLTDTTCADSDELPATPNNSSPEKRPDQSCKLKETQKIISDKNLSLANRQATTQSRKSEVGSGVSASSANNASHSQSIKKHNVQCKDKEKYVPPSVTTQGVLSPNSKLRPVDIAPSNISVGTVSAKSVGETVQAISLPSNHLPRSYILDLCENTMPPFLQGHTHFALIKKPVQAEYTDLVDRIENLLLHHNSALITRDVLNDYILKQLVHTPSGQYLVATSSEQFFILIPGVVK